MTQDIRNASPERSALLVMDHQRLLVEGYAADPAAHLETVAAVIEKARKAGLPVIYIQKTFRQGYPEVHDNNMIFSAVREGGRLLGSDKLTEIPGEIAPAENDIVIQAHRISAFEGSELSLVLRSLKIDTIIMFGIATSGVVLSTVRQGADMDYRLYVLRDLCADNDKDVHEFLLGKIISRQATVMSSSDFLDAF